MFVSEPPLIQHPEKLKIGYETPIGGLLEFPIPISTM